VIRASHGEIVDDAVTRIIDPTTIVASQISRQQLGHDLNLDGYDTELISFEGRPVWRNPFLGRRFMDEEIAISELLIRTAAWATDSGPEPYPLGRACEDHHLGLAIDHALAAGASVVTEPGPWAA
jgi:hypothetical protein